MSLWPLQATTLTGTFKDASGKAIRGSLTLTLSQPAIKPSDPSQIVPLSVTCNVKMDGTLDTCWVEGNDVLSPSGTYYKARLYDQSNRLLWEQNWTIQGAAVDVGTLTPAVTATAPSVNVIYSSPAPSGLTSQTLNTHLVPESANARDLGSGALGWRDAYIERINNVRYCDRFAGADSSAKINACAADLPATGGVANACGLQGAQSFSSNPFAGISKPLTLITCGATFSWNTESFLLDVGSDVRWVGNGTVLKPSSPGIGGFSDTAFGMINLRMTKTTGSISSGSKTLTVASATNIDVGDLVAVFGARGGNSNQRATISDGGDGITAVQTTIGVVSTSGFDTEGTVLIGSEVISYTGSTANSFTGCTRGTLGTTAATHADGANVDAVDYFISEVTAVSGTTVTLLEAATFTVSGATVEVGSSNISFEGDLTFNGNQNRAGPIPRNLVGIYGRLARRVYVAPTVKFRDIDHGGVFLHAARDSNIYGQYSGIGRPADLLGCDLWVFGPSERNEIHTLAHRDGDVAICVDDRTTSFIPLNGAPQDNVISMAPIQGDYKDGLILSGGNRNRVYAPSVEVTSNALLINSGQWTTNPVPMHNSIHAGYARGAGIGIASSAANGQNTLVVEAADATVTCAAGNLCLYRVPGGVNDDFQIAGDLIVGKDDATASVSVFLQSGTTKTWELRNTGADSLQLYDSQQNKLRLLADPGTNAGSEFNSNGTGTVDFNVRSGSGTGGVRFGGGNGANVATLSGTGNFTPAATGQDLGSTSARWDGFFKVVDTTGPMKVTLASADTTDRTSISGLANIPLAFAGNVAFLVGTYGETTLNGTGNVTGAAGALYGYAENVTQATVNSLFGAGGDAVHDAGTTTFLSGGKFSSTALGGSVTNQYGVFVESMDSTGASVANRYGFYLPVYGGTATNDWGFYQAGSQTNLFGGSVKTARAAIAGLVTVTFSATPAFNASLGNTQKITLTGNVTSSTLTNATAGQQLNFIICQDATGGRTFVWPTNIKGGMTIGATASKCSAQSFIFDGTNAYATSTGITNM